MTADSLPIIRVAYESISFKPQAQVLAEKLSLPIQVDTDAFANSFDYLLEFTQQGLALRPSADKGYGSIICDFAGSEHSHRRRYGGGTGLGGDGFVLASLGCNVCMLERNPIVHSLLADGLSRGIEAARQELEQGVDELSSVINRLSLLEGNAANYLSDLVSRITQLEPQAQVQEEQDTAVWRPDVVYVDPMFPLRKKSAKVKKQMQAFHAIVGTDPDADQLLANALTVAKYRVVVKRPAGAGFLAETKPNYSLEGKSTRYDIYALKKLPG